MAISSPFDISLSRSQQNPVLAGGPASLEDPFLGSLDGSGNDARWVGGGLPDAADMSEDDLRGNSAIEGGPLGDGDIVLEGVFDPDGMGEEVNGLGGS